MFMLIFPPFFKVTFGCLPLVQICKIITVRTSNWRSADVCWMGTQFGSFTIKTCWVMSFYAVVRGLSRIPFPMLLMKTMIPLLYLTTQNLFIDACPLFGMLWFQIYIFPPCTRNVLWLGLVEHLQSYLLVFWQSVNVLCVLHGVQTFVCLWDWEHVYYYISSLSWFWTE